MNSNDCESWQLARYVHFKKFHRGSKNYDLFEQKKFSTFFSFKEKNSEIFWRNFFSSTLGHIFVSSSCHSPGKGDTRQKVNDYDDDDTDRIPRILWSELLFVGYFATPIHPSIDKEKNLSSHPTELKSF